MKKIFKLILVLLLVGAAVIGWYIWKKGESLYPEFKKMEQVKLEHIGLFPPEIRMRADAVFHHENPVGITLSRMDLKVQIEDLDAAQVVQRKEVYIKPAADFTVPLQIKIPLSDNEALGHLKSLLEKSKDNGKLKYHLEGKLFFDIKGAEIGIPMDFTDYFQTGKSN